MKKYVSLILCALTLMLCVVSVDAVAEGTVVTVPAKAAAWKNILAEMDELPLMSTLTNEYGLTTIYLSEDIDKLVAQWAGYYEENEEVPVVNGIGELIVSGHKYQVGSAPYKKYNKAYEVTKGGYTILYNRKGSVASVNRTEENTDYFKTGVLGAEGTVTWLPAPNGYRISAVHEEYPEGDIAECTAQYLQDGRLIRYWLTYRTGQDETYTIKYDADNNQLYGTYKGIDKDGYEIEAYTASKTQWADTETGKLTTSAGYNWYMRKFTDRLFRKPPRR